MKIVVARGAHLGAAGKAGLEQQAGRIARRVLVDLVLVAGACMVEERGGCRYREAGGRVGYPILRVAGDAPARA
jgi:hypothetical protein